MMKQILDISTALSAEPTQMIFRFGVLGVEHLIKVAERVDAL
jgi:hypothetical protein